ncbi:DUF3098 domain-containing protein [Reichenbachiella sp. MALMAid0571]|uniref:DUF3098 domain-containing protein n=1 Tax=Reichenbachiella sp. MALMAid0571 TaxID=3143939 RepID=UPI0032DED539
MSKNNKLAFTKQNYILMVAGIVVLILGFILMSMDTEPYGFGILGLTIGPMTVLAGFIIQFFAILHKSKEDK